MSPKFLLHPQITMLDKTRCKAILRFTSFSGDTANCKAAVDVGGFVNSPEVSWTRRRMTRLSPRNLQPHGRQGIDSSTWRRRQPQSVRFAGQSTKPPASRASPRNLRHGPSSQAVESLQASRCRQSAKPPKPTAAAYGSFSPNGGTVTLIWGTGTLKMGLVPIFGFCGGNSRPKTAQRLGRA